MVREIRCACSSKDHLCANWCGSDTADAPLGEWDDSQVNICNEKITVYSLQQTVSYGRGGAKVYGQGKPQPMKVCGCVFLQSLDM